MLLTGSFVVAEPDEADGAAIVINGLGGSPELEENFVAWATGLTQVFTDKFPGSVYYIDGRSEPKEAILQTFDRVVAGSAQEIWLVLVGHANHDGQTFKFHMKGPDLSGEEIQSFLHSLGSRKAFVVAGTSASGVLIPELQGEHRVIVTATKSQFERQPPLFLSFFIEAARSADADRDKNGRVSLLEAFLFSRAEVEKWFQGRGLLQTEHPLLDDQGGIQLGGDAESLARPGPGGERLLAATAYFSAPSEEAYRTVEARELGSRRQEVEREIETLKLRKQQMALPAYYQELERLLIRLAELTRKIDELETTQ